MHSVEISRSLSECDIGLTGKINLMISESRFFLWTYKNTFYLRKYVDQNFSYRIFSQKFEWHATSHVLCLEYVQALISCKAKVIKDNEATNFISLLHTSHSRSVFSKKEVSVKSTRSRLKTQTKYFTHLTGPFLLKSIVTAPAKAKNSRIHLLYLSCSNEIYFIFSTYKLSFFCLKSWVIMIEDSRAKLKQSFEEVLMHFLCAVCGNLIFPSQKKKYNYDIPITADTQFIDNIKTAR